MGRISFQVEGLDVPRQLGKDIFLSLTMFTRAALVVLGAQGALGGLTEIVGGLKQLQTLIANGTDEQQAAFTENTGFDRKLDNTVNDKAFTGFIEDFLNSINGYACWCNFGDKYENSRGPVQDSVDAECKILIHGYRCCEIDAAARSETCDIVTKVYTPYNFFSSNTDLRTDCELNNPGDQCGIDLCVVEGRFTLAFFDQFFQTFVTFDPALQHPDTAIAANAGTFDASTECRINPTGYGKAEQACCGIYEQNRYTFKLEDGGRACCEPAQKTFVTASHECCAAGGDAGTVQLFGDCSP